MAEWGVSGNVLIACNCDFGCPCNFNARPSRGHCEGGWIWLIEKGHVGAVRLETVKSGPIRIKADRALLFSFASATSPPASACANR